MRVDIVRDAGERVETSVRNVEEALVEGALLTVLVVFLFLNSWRSTVITGLALPVSVLASFIAVWAFGFTLNTMSLLGLSLAIGILIDDAIVVRENIVRHVEMGKDHYTRRPRGHRRDRPRGRRDDVLDRRGVRAGRVHAGRRRAVVQAVRADHRLLGAGVALRLVLARPDALGVLARSAAPRRTSTATPISRTLDRFNTWFDRQAERYKRVIAWALDHRLAMVALAAGSFVGAIALQVAVRRLGFMPVSDNSELTMHGRDAAGLEPRVHHRSRPRRRRVSRASCTEVPTPTPRSAATRAPSTPR